MLKKLPGGPYTKKDSERQYLFKGKLPSQEDGFLTFVSPTVSVYALYILPSKNI